MGWGKESCSEGRDGDDGGIKRKWKENGWKKRKREGKRGRGGCRNGKKKRRARKCVDNDSLKVKRWDEGKKRDEGRIEKKI